MQETVAVAQINEHILSALHCVISAVHRSRPWRLFQPGSFFEIEDYRTNTRMFATVGMPGLSPKALRFHRDVDALQFHLARISKNIDSDWDDLFAVEHALSIDFTGKRSLDSHDLSQLDARPSEKFYPKLRSGMRGFMPWYIDEQEASFLTYALYGMLHLIDCFGSEFRKHSSEHYLSIRGMSDHMPHVRWDILRHHTSELLHPRPEQSEANSERLDFRPLPQDGTWEAHVFHVNRPIFEGVRPAYIRMGLVVDADRNKILSAKLLKTDEDSGSGLSELVCSLIEERQSGPQAVRLAKSELSGSVTTALSRFGVSVEQSKDLPSLRQAKQFLEDTLLRELHRAEVEPERLN